MAEAQPGGGCHLAFLHLTPTRRSLLPDSGKLERTSLGAFSHPTSIWVACSAVVSKIKAPL